ncbi:MAG: DUF896 domain-containing protein [Anaerotignaceae bacterium]
MNKNEETARLLRINELAHKAKTEALTAEELAERDVLRKEYLLAFRANMMATMEKISIVEEDGSYTPVVKKDK